MRAVISAETECLYEFGEFRLDPAARTLWRREEAVALTPKVFDTLQFLVENAGRLLEKSELMESLWRDRFVEESNLTFNIKMLRRALNDDAQRPRFIETVPRRGYRFVAEVRRISRTAPATEIAPAIPRAMQPRRKLFWAIPAGLLVIVGALAFSMWRWQRGAFAGMRSAPILSAPFKSQKLTNAGSAHAVITPDGKYAAYVSESGGNQSIWLRQLDTSENIQIVPPANVEYLGMAISHDGNSLYFVRRAATDLVTSAMYRVMTFGGIPVKIIDQAEGWIDVSPDDQQISFVRCLHQPKDNCSLFLIGKDGRNERRIATREKPTRIAANKFSRDGKSIVFAAGQSVNGGRDFRLFSVDLAGGNEAEFSHSAFFVVNHLATLPGVDAFLFSAEETLDGNSRLWEVAANGETRALTNDSTDYYEISLDRAGDRLVATRLSNSFQLHLLALAGDAGSAQALVPARTLTFTADDRLIYSGDDGDLWTINRDGSNQRQLTNNSFNDFSPAPSPDGRFIFFASNRAGSNQIWRMNADGSDQIQITRGEGGYPEMVTPDGNYVYYQSGLHQTLWQVALGSGQETQLWDQSVSAPAFSPDGKQVAFCFRDTDKLLKIAIVAIEDRRILKRFALNQDYTDVLKMVWARDSHSLFYVAVSSSGKYLREQSLDESASRLVADLGRDEIEDLALSPDGRTIGFTRGKWIHAALLVEGLK
jgi:Tol biopolymer transport system component/DNA-binding winged helix-turn-helix (wHTH) protein